MSGFGKAKTWGKFKPKIMGTLFREAKFKRALRLHFLTHFTKTFCRFLTLKVKSGTDIIDPSISKALILYFGITNVLSRIFENSVKNRQTKFHILKFRMCVNTH